MNMTRDFGRRAFTACALSCLAAALGGCGDATTIDTTGVVIDEQPTPTPAPTGTTIGADGGVVVSDDGLVRLDIPANALASPVAIEIAAADTTLLLGDGPTDRIAFIYDLQPSGLEFLIPARLTVTATPTVDDEDDDSVAFTPALMVTESADGTLELLRNQAIDVDFTRSQLVYSGDINHFSGLVGEAGPFRIRFFAPRTLESGSRYTLITEARGAGGFELDSATGTFQSQAPFVLEGDVEVLSVDPSYRQTVTCDTASIVVGDRYADLYTEGEFVFAQSETTSGANALLYVAAALTNGALSGDDAQRTFTLAATRESECLAPTTSPPTEPIGVLEPGFLECGDASRCGGLEQGGLLQSSEGLQPAWATGTAPPGDTCRLGIEPCAFGPYDDPRFIAITASSEGAISAIDVESGEQIGEFLGGQDPFFGASRAFAPFGVLPLLPTVPGADESATVLTYGQALEGSSTAGRFQRSNAPAEEFRDPNNPNDFGQAFTHITGNSFFLDATTFGGNIRADGGLLASDSGLRLFRFNPDERVLEYNTFRFVDIGPVLSAFVVQTDTDTPGPALALQDSPDTGALLQHVDLNSADVTTVGSVAANPRQIRCNGGLCFATSAGVEGATPSQLKWWTWDGTSAVVTERGVLDLGGTGASGDSAFAQVIGLDTVRFDNGNIGVVAFGFSNGTVYEIAVTGENAETPGIVARQGQTQTSSACPNPGHGRWTTDAGQLKWIALCNGGGGLEVGDALIASPTDP